MLEFMAVPLWATMPPIMQLGHNGLKEVARRRSPVWQRVASELRRELVERLNRLVNSDKPTGEFGTVEWHIAEAT